MACNLSCRHCGSDCSSGRDTAGELTTDEIISGFESIAARYNPHEIMIAVTGGEPLLRKDLFTVMERVRTLGFPWGMVTNGLAMTRAMVERCRQTGMRTITVSLDGLKDDHNWLRRNDQSFDRAIGAVRLLGEAGFLSSLQVATAVSRKIIDRLPDIYDLVRKEPVDEWRLLTIFPGGRARGNEDVLLGAGDYRKLYSFVRDIRKDKPSIMVSVDEEGYLGCDFEREVRDGFYDCPAGIKVGGILANGDISACPSISRKLVQGNVRTEPFTDCWENRFHPFRDRRWMKQGACASCSEWWICRGNSLHLWNFDTNQPDVCHYRCLNEKEGV